MTNPIYLLTPQELRTELGAAILELDTLGNHITALRGQVAERDAKIERLREALRRYYIYEQFCGEKKLYAEFGPPKYPESSISCTEWLERVLREPARAALEQEQS